MQIRPYTTTDDTQILRLFQLNVPTFFSEEEEKDLIDYLANERELYFVGEMAGQLIGCGGINFSADKSEAIISWDIFHPDFHNKGFGSQLLQFRLEKIHTFKEVKTIIVRTSQLTYPFYEKNGFELLETVKDYWAPGFDLYRMEYK